METPSFSPPGINYSPSEENISTASTLGELSKENIAGDPVLEQPPKHKPALIKREKLPPESGLTQTSDGILQEIYPKGNNFTPDGNQRSVAVQPFVLKTYNIVNDPRNNEYISWSSVNGNHAFVVYDPDAFAKNVLPYYFKHNNFRSFVRQLNFYGFHKIDSTEGCCFDNQFFRKGHPELLPRIGRRRGKPHISLEFLSPDGKEITDDIEYYTISSDGKTTDNILQQFAERFDELGGIKRKRTCPDNSALFAKNPEFTEKLQTMERRISLLSQENTKICNELQLLRRELQKSRKIEREMKEMIGSLTESVFFDPLPVKDFGMEPTTIPPPVIPTINAPSTNSAEYPAAITTSRAEEPFTYPTFFEDETS